MDPASNFFDPLEKIENSHGIGDTIRIGWGIQCLPYAGFLA